MLKGLGSKTAELCEYGVIDNIGSFHASKSVAGVTGRLHGKDLTDGTE